MRTIAAAMLYCILMAFIALIAVLSLSCDALNIIVDWLEDLLEKVHP